MSQKTVFIAGFIGLFFGFLFAGTLGVSFFEEDSNYNVPLNTNGDVDPEVEQFRLDYNLTETIYIPVSGAEVEEMISNNEDFIVFAGTKTCPYCKQFVPVLQRAAQSLGVDVIYYVDIALSENDDYLDDAGFAYPNSTFVYVNGMIEDSIVGTATENNTISFLSDYYGE